MTQYLVAVHLPDDFDPIRDADVAMDKDIDVLNDEMVARGVRIFVGGLRPARQARTLRRIRGRLSVTDGPFIEAKEHVGGFWVLECASDEEAMEWGRKATVACRAPVEVRPFY